MKFRFDKEKFIRDHITGRPHSLAAHDIEINHKRLEPVLNGQTVLVIGGAGTIGSSYIKSILPFKPGKIIVVDHNENGLTELVRDLRSSHDVLMPSSFITYPVDFGTPLFRKILDQNPVDILASFAAHKHVRSEKDLIAIEAMITNNVFNTNRLLNLALQYKPSHVFAVSTDKAANPVNIMGGSKKLMEKLILAYSGEVPVTTARFANVAFSNGSLLDGFINRLIAGQPITAPTDVRRYFVTPTESGDICMLASLLGDPGDIFFPKLGVADMLTFSEIADSFLDTIGMDARLCATEEEAKEMATYLTDSSFEYPVYFFESDTTGEKLYEEFYTPEEIIDLYTFESLGIVKASSKPLINKVENDLNELRELFNQPNSTKEDLVALFKKIMPEFDHEEKGKNLDMKM